MKSLSESFATVAGGAINASGGLGVSLTYTDLSGNDFALTGVLSRPKRGAGYLGMVSRMFEDGDTVTDSVVLTTTKPSAFDIVRNGRITEASGKAWSVRTAVTEHGITTCELEASEQDERSRRGFRMHQ